MKQKSKISAYQLYAIFFVCRTMALFTFISPQQTPFEPGDRLIMFIPFSLFEILFSVPVFLVVKNGGTLADLSEKISPVLKKCISVLYFAGFVWSAGVSVARFELFVSTVMFPQSQLNILIFLLIVACVYIALKGVETVGRCCVPFSVIMLLCIFAIIAATISKFDINNLTPLFYSGITPVIKNGFSSAARTTELSALMFILPSVNGKYKKGFFIWLISFALLSCSLLYIIAGITGKYGDSQMFQMYTLTVLAKFGFIEKADDLLMGLWVLCSLFRTSFYIIISSKILKGGFNFENQKLPEIFSGICVFTVFLILSKSVTVFSGLLSSGVNGVLYAVMTGVIPIIVFLGVKLKQRYKRKVCV